jgi:hypothetical protein
MKNSGKYDKLIRICLLTLLFTTVLTPIIFGSDTGWHYPQDYSVASGSYWQNPVYVLTCNSIDAYYMGLNTGDTLFTFNYGFSLPINVIIDSLWYKYRGAGSGDGDAAIVQISFIVGANRDIGSQFILSSVYRTDSAHVITFDRNVISNSNVNSTSFGLYVITAGDELLTDTYIDCVAIKIFYHEPTSSPRRQRIIKMEDE